MLCLTVSLPWPIMLLHSADPVSSTCCLAKGDQAVTDAGCNKDSGACFCQQSTGQLQQPTGWCQQLIATTAPSHPEHCRSSCYRSQKIRAYDTDPTWSSLAAGSTADHVQDSSSGLQVSARQGSTVPPDILWADVNSCHPASSIRLTLADWLFHAPEQTTATAVSPSKDLVHGTVFLLHCEHQTLHWQRSGTNWRHFCSMCNCSYSAFAAF